MATRAGASLPHDAGVDVPSDPTGDLTGDGALDEGSDLPAISLGNQSQGFRSELSQWLETLRQSLGQLLREVGSPPTPRALQMKLKVPYSPCWRIFRIVRAVDVTAEAKHAPSPAGLKGILTSARKHGATDDTVAAVTTAAEQFVQFITRHAEDRSTFESMVADDTAGGQSDTLLLRRRRSAYRSLSQLWGVQTDLQCLTFMLGPPGNSPPGTDPAHYAQVKLSLQRGVRRLRADAQVTLMGYRIPPGDLANYAGPLPLDANAAATYGMPILPEFSSSPLPVVQPTDRPNGWRLYNLVGGDVGLRSNIDIALGEHVPANIPEPDSQGRPVYAMNFVVNRKPIALLVMDLLVHRSTYPTIRPRSMVYQYQEGDYSQSAAETSQRFPGDEKVTFAGRADTLDLMEAPRYAELLRFTAAAKAWNLADFDAYRLRIPFPVINTLSRIYYYG